MRTTGVQRSALTGLGAMRAGCAAWRSWNLHGPSRLGTNLIDGINDQIRVIRRMAYGFRDDAYFFLEIRAACPGAGR
jgi:hypothetical protein